MVIIPWSYMLSAISSVGERTHHVKRLDLSGGRVRRDLVAADRGIKVRLTACRQCALRVHRATGCTNVRLSSLLQSRTNARDDGRNSRQQRSEYKSNTDRGWRAVSARTNIGEDKRNVNRNDLAEMIMTHACPVLSTPVWIADLTSGTDHAPRTPHSYQSIYSALRYIYRNRG
jgi:hypothetical protein